MTSTDFIKVRGLQSTPGEGADVSSFEVFQGASCGGAGGVGVTNLPTAPGTIPTVPTLPGGGTSWGETLSRLFGMIGSLAGTAGEIIKTTAFGEIVTGILGLAASGAGSAAIAALMYLGSKLVGGFALDYLDEKTGFEADLMEVLKKIHEQIETYPEKWDASNLLLQGMADNIFMLRGDLFELRKFLQTGVGDENLTGTEGGIVQALKDIASLDAAIQIPNSDVYFHIKGGIVRK